MRTKLFRKVCSLRYLCWSRARNPGDSYDGNNPLVLVWLVWLRVNSVLFRTRHSGKLNVFVDKSSSQEYNENAFYLKCALEIYMEIKHYDFDNQLSRMYICCSSRH